MDTYNADQQLKENPNDAAAKKQLADAQKTLQTTLKTIDSMIQGTFTPSGGKKGGTVLQQFTADYTDSLSKSIEKLVTYGEKINSARYTMIRGELDSIEAGNQSAIMPDVDYSAVDYAREIQVLNLLDREIDKAIESSTSESSKNDAIDLKKRIEARIEEFKNYAKNPLEANALDKRLDLANKIQDDRIASLKRAFGIDFAKTYKTVADQQAAFRDLKQVLDTYNIPYSDFFATNKIAAPGFILYLIGDMRTDGGRLSVLARVMGAAEATSYATQNIRLGYLETALQSPELKKYSATVADSVDFLRKEITDRKAQIKTFIAAQKAGKIPQPPEGTMAAKLKLSEKIPSDQIKAVQQYYVEVNDKIQKFFEEQKKYKGGDNIYTWERETLTELQDILKPMQELLNQSAELYHFDIPGEFENQFVNMKDTIDGLAVQVDAAIKSQPTIAETVYNDVSNLFSNLFSVNVALS